MLIQNMTRNRVKNSSDVRIGVKGKKAQSFKLPPPLSSLTGRECRNGAKHEERNL